MIYSDVTRDYIKHVLEEAKGEASAIVEEELKEEDLILWLSKANSILGKVNGNPTLYNISKIVDTSNITPSFKLDKRLKFCKPELFFWGINIRKISIRIDYKSGKNSVERLSLQDWYNWSEDRIYLQEGITSPTKDFFLLQDNEAFITVQAPTRDELLEQYVRVDPTTDFEKKWTEDYVNSMIDKRDAVLAHLKASKHIRNYDEVIVPEEFTKEFTEREIKEGEIDKTKNLTPKELRALDNKILLYRPSENDWNGDYYRYKKYEVKASKFKDSEKPTYYGHQDDELKIAYAAFVTNYNDGDINDIVTIDDHLNRVERDTNIDIFRASQTLSSKLFTNHKYINKFFKEEAIIDKKVSMSKFLVNYYTGKLIHDKLHQLEFLKNYKSINIQIHELYTELVEYKKIYYRDIAEWRRSTNEVEEFHKETMHYCANVFEMQTYIRDHKDNPELIKAKSMELFGVDTVETALGVDLAMYDKLQNLLEYAEPVKDLFNHVEVLTCDKSTISPQTESLINEYLHFKGLTNFKIHTDDSVETTVPVQEVAEEPVF